MNLLKPAAPAERLSHLSYCGGSFGRVSLMAADAELADHARDCRQLLVNVHDARLVVRVDGTTRSLRPFDALVIGPRQTYAIPPQAGPRHGPGVVGFILVKATRSPAGLRPAHVRGLPRPLLGPQPLSKGARDDAVQLVSELSCDLPEVGAVEAGVHAMTGAVACMLDVGMHPGRQVGLQAQIAAEAESLGLDDLLDFHASSCRAATFGVSERHFLTLFRRATQLAPRAYYNMRRLEAAFAMLGDGSRAVADIAYQLGFSAPPHFTRFMRANTGWTPSAYRAQVQRLPPLLRPQGLPWRHPLQ